MGDQGTLAQSAIGGFELATGSKPALHCLHVTGKYTNGDALFINSEGTASANSGATTGFSVVYGAGSLTLGTIAAAGTPVAVVFGSGDNKDDIDIVGAHGSISWDDGGGSTFDTAGACSVSSINGGTVNLLVQMIGADGEAGPPVSGTDTYRLIVYAHARSNL
tara:strand:+ start:3088 stop:3576 length:489 start_codon:yes stop_codon:yes gene_type:complete